MKFSTFFIIALVLVCLFFNSNTRRIRRRRTTTQTISAKTFALKTYPVTIQIDGKEAGKGDFTIESLNKPKGEENIGWIFKIDGQPSELLKKSFVPSGKGAYLPYRNITQDILYVNPFGTPKRYEISVSNAQREAHVITILLPYGEKKTFINDEEANALRGLVNTLRIKNQVKLNNYYKTASVEAGNYINTKPLLNAANKGEESFSAAVKISSNESDALALIIKNDSDSYDEINSEYEKVQNHFTDLRNKLNGLNERISLNKNIRLLKDNNIRSYKDKKAADVKTSLTEETKKSKEKFSSTIDKIIKEIPKQKKFLESAKKEVTVNLDLEKYNKLVSKFYTGY